MNTNDNYYISEILKETTLAIVKANIWHLLEPKFKSAYDLCQDLNPVNTPMVSLLHEKYYEFKQFYMKKHLG